MKKKQWIAITAVTIATAFGAVTGTFAWQSIRQIAKNEKTRSLNPGARLHDDFDGENKDVYVENYTDPNLGDAVFARIRMREYLEVGTGAGEPDGTLGKTAKSVITGAAIDDTTSWTIHSPYNMSDTFHSYFKWTVGGKTNYMPTFNKLTENLDPDINGTLAGSGDGPYSDYVDYTKVTSVTADEVCDTGTIPDVTHTAAETLDAKVMSMHEWQAAGGKKGPYWVYDQDGWAYWADGIQPGTATGCLLNGIEYIGGINGEYYYSINVEAEFVTSDEWGIDAENNGYFSQKDGNKEVASKEALILLETAAGNKKILKIENDEGTTVIDLNNELQFSAKAVLGKMELDLEAVQWSIEGNHSDTTVIDRTGKVTIGANEVSAKITIKATATVNGENIEGSYDLYVNVPTYTIQIEPKTNTGERQEITKNYAVLGRNRTFIAKTLQDGVQDSSKSVSWSVSAVGAHGETVPTTSTIAQNGVLTVSASESASKLIVKATSTFNSEITGTYEVDVISEFMYIPCVQVGSTETVYIDGYHWYVLAQNGDEYLLWSKDSMYGEPYAIIGTNSSELWNWGDWSECETRQWFNSDLKDELVTFKDKIVKKTIYSYNPWLDNPKVETQDYLFLLTAADLGGTATYSYEYTFGGRRLVSDAILADVYNNGRGLTNTWIRAVLQIEDMYWLYFDYAGKQVVTYPLSQYLTTKASDQAAMWIRIN